MSRIRVHHRTEFKYAGRITETVMEVRLKPFDGQGQRLLEWDLEIRPQAEIRSYVDGFGNHVDHFNRLRQHSRVLVVADSLTETGFPPEAPDSDLVEDFLLFRGPVVETRGVRALARPAAGPESAEATVHRLDDLTARLRKRVRYQPNSTNVHSTVEEVLRLGLGVCQDFAHLFIATCRSMGIPARYVSGYVHDGPPGRRVGASHAWAEAWIPDLGWVGFDPTHPPRPGPGHVRVAVGRDYRDAAPTRGVYVGVAKGTMRTEVVTELEG